MVNPSMNIALLKCQSFAQTVNQLSALALLDLAETTQGSMNAALVLDGLKNGLAQKFELATEQCWKAIKSVLLERDGVDEASPKKVIKAFFLAEYISESQYQNLIQAIDDRNKLAHVYGAD